MMGERIATLRKAAGMSQAQLAQALKISSSAMGMYEQNRREPSLATVVNMAQILGVSVTYLVTGKTESFAEAMAMEKMFIERTAMAGSQTEQRGTRPVSRQELATMLAAMLIDP